MARRKLSIKKPSQTPLESSLFSVVENLSKSLAAITESLSRAGRQTYKPIDPRPVRRPTEDELMAAALMVPDYDQIKIVDDVHKFPQKSAQKVMLREEAQKLLGGANGAFQGRYRAQDPAAKLEAAAERGNRGRSGQGNVQDQRVVSEAQPEPGQGNK